MLWDRTALTWRLGGRCHWRWLQWDIDSLATVLTSLLSPLPSVSLFLYPASSLSTHDLLSPSQRLIHHDLYLSISFTPTQRRCAGERCIDCLTEEPEHCLTRKTLHHKTHIFPHGRTFTAFSGQKKSIYEHLFIINAHWMRFVDGKQALYISNYTTSTLTVNKPLQLGDMWNPALAVETLLVPAISHPARLQTRILNPMKTSQRQK